MAKFWTSWATHRTPDTLRVSVAERRARVCIAVCRSAGTYEYEHCVVEPSGMIASQIQNLNASIRLARSILRIYVLQLHFQSTTAVRTDHYPRDHYATWQGANEASRLLQSWRWVRPSEHLEREPLADPFHFCTCCRSMSL